MRKAYIGAAAGLLVSSFLLAVPVWAETDAGAEAPEKSQTEEAGTEASAKKTAAEIRQCARANFPRETSVQQLSMTAHDRSGGTRTLESRMYWRMNEEGYSEVMIRVYSPNDLAGSSYLVLEREERDDMFMYLPAVNRVRRIVGGMRSKPLWGTDLSYEDIKQLQGVALAGSLTRLPDAAVGERDAYVIQSSYAKDDETAYGRVVTHIDKDTCMPLQVDFFDRTDAAVKKLTVDPDTLVQVGDRWQMQDLKMQDLHNETHTVLKIEERESDEEISERIFNRHSFHMGG